MTDVFFRGYGYWANLDGDPEDPECYGLHLTETQITSTYQANGVFSLNKDDEIAYKHFKSFKCFNTLIKSTHSDDEFLKFVSLSDFDLSDKYPNFIFHIDTSQPREGLVIAVPDKPPVYEKLEITETERATMLKLILCMAMDSYKHNPDSKKNSSTGDNYNNIKTALEKYGLSLDNKTISKYLKEAAERYPDARPPKS